MVSIVIVARGDHFTLPTSSVPRASARPQRPDGHHRIAAVRFYAARLQTTSSSSSSTNTHTDLPESVDEWMWPSRDRDGLRANGPIT